MSKRVFFAQGVRKMAFRAARQHWRSLVANGNRPFASSTTPKMKLFSPTADSIHSEHHHKASAAIKGDFVPVVVVLGTILVAVSIGVHTAKQQLVHSPSVRVNKKRRESVPEVDDPDHIVGGSEKFIDKSFLRKVAHIQDHHIISDPARPNPYTRVVLLYPLSWLSLISTVVEFPIPGPDAEEGWPLTNDSDGDIRKVCHTGFQRDHNLQLASPQERPQLAMEAEAKADHTSEEEDVHMPPSQTVCTIAAARSRAVGDFTGIKKHFSICTLPLDVPFVEFSCIKCYFCR
ncbi:hypothetical protein RHMOL_Rhmol12G0018200 [Rhododendron molle]|uniref:Uncharacterized protein n=1 Tax=Rhododendron molle TaxID=49168 RepID=A0ACC0LEE0_RHOML|nr:hypothetical protein RHMOL_Rhmol12G0018200 [Rhododendron molle]